MSLTPDAVVREWFDQVWNRLDGSAIERLMASDGVVHGLAPQPLRGPNQFKPFYDQLKNVLGDIRVDVERTIVQGDSCAVWCHVTARYLGDPAANRRVDFYGMTMARVREGRIVEGWNSFDFLTMYQQLGWVPDPVQPA
jgi:predicted ester cyclase